SPFSIVGREREGLSSERCCISGVGTWISHVSSQRRHGPLYAGHPRLSSKDDRSDIQRLVEIVPRRVKLMDEPYLPCAWPLLDSCFARKRAFDFLVSLHKNQPLQAIAFRE